MYNKYYRINESRWTLPEENEYFKYSDYGYDKEEYNYIKEKNLEEGWNKNIIEELTKFYNENKDYMIIEYEKLDNMYLYWYIDFSYLIPDELNIMKNKYNFYYNKDKDKTFLVREVIRNSPKLNPSDILFSDLYVPSMVELTIKLSCAIKLYGFEYFNNSLIRRMKYIYFLGHSFEIY